MKISVHVLEFGWGDVVGSTKKSNERVKNGINIKKNRKFERNRIGNSVFFRFLRSSRFKKKKKNGKQGKIKIKIKIYGSNSDDLFRL